MKLICVLAIVLPLSAAIPSRGAEPSAPAAAAARAGSAIPIEELIDRVARRTGRQFVVDPRVRADVLLTGLDVERVDYDRLLAILRVNQFIAIPEKGFVTIVPDAGARQIPVKTYHDLAFKAGDDELVTVLLTAKNLCAAHSVPVLRPLMPQAAHLAALPQANSVIINDRAANARRIGELFEKLDRLAPTGARCETGLDGSK